MIGASTCHCGAETFYLKATADFVRRGRGYIFGPISCNCVIYWVAICSKKVVRRIAGLKIYPVTGECSTPGSCLPHRRAVELGLTYRERNTVGERTQKD